MTNSSPRIAVVGAGAAGIFAAWKAATGGAEVHLFEKTPRIGTKILISGGGKCNITHDGPLEDLIRAFRPNEARFIRPACYRFTNQDVVQMLTDRNLAVYTRPDGRIFPVDGTAKDVVRILQSYLQDAGVQTHLQTPVTDLLVENGAVIGVRTAKSELHFDSVIVCVGGSSYPNSGTTGDGWKWSESLGHKIVQPTAALAPIDTSPKPPDAHAGVALRDIDLKARQNGKEFVRWHGDLLFTHHGISGPTTLGISRDVAEKRRSGPVTLEVDLAPSLSFEVLQSRLAEWILKNAKKQIYGFIVQFVPQSLVLAIASLAEIREGLSVHQLPRKQRSRLVEILKMMPIGNAKTVVFDKGEVVAGGVALDEIDPHTMRSLIVKNLYLCGEVLDVAGPVGGYNLQAAFATGFVAGESAASLMR